MSDIPHFLDPGKIVSQAGVGEGNFVADFGCGSGHLTLILAQIVGKDGRVEAIDVQTSALESVKERVTASGLENTDFVRADLEVLGGTKLLENSQDFVFVQNTLFQSQKKLEMIREARRILKSGAKVVIVDWKKGIGGLGPPDSLRTEESELQNLVATEGFTFDQPINAGPSHFGFIMVKTS